MISLRTAFCVLLALGVGLTSCKRAEQASSESPLTSLRRLWPVPDFSLTERSGRTVTLADLKGKVWVADFIFTSCPGTCLLLSGSMRSLHQELGARDEIRFVSFSADPQTDTPEVLRKYAEQYQASERWLFLTGDKAAIWKLCQEGFKLAIADAPSSAELITHSTKLILVDKTGMVRGFYEGTGGEGLKQLRADVEKLVKE